MRIALTVLATALSIGVAAAQSTPTQNTPATDAAQNKQSDDKLQSTGKAPGDSPHSTGRTILSTDGQKTPQGDSGPVGTTSGGAPAASPQGQTPPGYQSAPDGSSKTIVDQKSQ